MIRLICADGEVVLARPYFQKMSLFDDPQIARADSYKLQCKPSTGVMNILLRRVYAESAHIEITKDNFNELKSLCRELGFTGLDAEFREFEGPTRNDASQEILSLNDRIARHDKLLLEVQHQLAALSRLVNDKFRAESEFRESMTRQVQTLEAKVEMVARKCEERCVNTSHQLKTALGECVKREDIDSLAQDVAQLKERERSTTSVGEEMSGVCKQDRPDGDDQQPLTREEILRRFSPKESDFYPSGEGAPEDGCYHLWIDHRNNREVPVAIKVVDNGWCTSDPRYFWREVSILTTLRHETVISLTAIVPEKRMIIVPWMKNGTLEDVLRMERQGEAPAGWNATKKSIVLFGTAVAMAYIHSKNVTHRELSLRSVWLNDNFEPVVSDFVTGDRWDGRMCPFQVALCQAADATYEEACEWKTRDVYSYAMVVYLMFTDRPLLERSHFQCLSRIRHGNLDRVPEIPDSLWEMILLCMSGCLSFVEIVNVLRAHTEELAFPGTDLGVLREYQARVVRGVAL